MKKLSTLTISLSRNTFFIKSEAVSRTDNDWLLFVKGL